jgi:hypothetical protein
MVLKFLEIYHDKRQMNTYKLETIQISSKGKRGNICEFFALGKWKGGRKFWRELRI